MCEEFARFSTMTLVAHVSVWGLCFRFECLDDNAWNLDEENAILLTSTVSVESPKSNGKDNRSDNDCEDNKRE
jgi:hypothetical protein